MRWHQDKYRQRNETKISFFNGIFWVPRASAVPSDDNRQVKPLILAGSPVRTSLGVRKDGREGHKARRKIQYEKVLNFSLVRRLGVPKRCVSAFQSTTKTHCRINSESKLRQLSDPKKSRCRSLGTVRCVNRSWSWYDDKQVGHRERLERLRWQRDFHRIGWLVDRVRIVKIACSDEREQRRR